MGRKVMARGTHGHFLLFSRWGSLADPDTYVKGAMRGWKMDNRPVEGSLKKQKCPSAR